MFLSHCVIIFDKEKFTEEKINGKEVLNKLEELYKVKEGKIILKQLRNENALRRAKKGLMPQAIVCDIFKNWKSRCTQVCNLAARSRAAKIYSSCSIP